MRRLFFIGRGFRQERDAGLLRFLRQIIVRIGKCRGMIGAQVERFLIVRGGAGQVTQMIVADGKIDPCQITPAIGTRKSDAFCSGHVVQNHRAVVPHHRASIPAALSVHFSQPVGKLAGRVSVSKGVGQYAFGKQQIAVALVQVGQMDARLDAVVRMRVGIVAGTLEHGDRLCVIPVEIQFATVIKNLSGRIVCARSHPFAEDIQIAFGRIVFDLVMLDRRAFEIDDPSRRDNDFVYRIRPTVVAGAAQDTFAPKGASGVSRAVEIHAVGQHYDVGVVCIRFESQDGVDGCVGQDVVRVQPHDIVARCIGKTVVACRGKVVDPIEAIYFVGKLSGNFDGIVRTACVYDHELIGDTFCAGQTAGEHFVFVLDDHTDTECFHGAGYAREARECVITFAGIEIGRPSIL